MKCRSQSNIVNKLPIQFSYAENTATYTLLPFFTICQPGLFFHLLAPEFSSRTKESSPRLVARIDSLSHFSTLCNQICCRCSFDNNEVKCKYRRIESLRIRSPRELRQDLDKTPFNDKKRERESKRKSRACCHFERERKYVAVGIPLYEPDLSL